MYIFILLYGTVSTTNFTIYVLHEQWDGWENTIGDRFVSKGKELRVTYFWGDTVLGMQPIVFVVTISQ